MLHTVGKITEKLTAKITEIDREQSRFFVGGGYGVISRLFLMEKGNSVFYHAKRMFVIKGILAFFYRAQGCLFGDSGKQMLRLPGQIFAR